MNFCLYRTVTPTLELSSNMDWNWIVEYRACQLLSKQVNDSIGAYFLPIHFISIMIQAVLASYVLIRFEIELVFVISMIVLDVLILYYLSIWKKGTSFTKSSKLVIEKQKFSYKSIYSKIVFRSCKPISIELGKYYTLTENLLLAVFDAIVQATISLLLI